MVIELLILFLILLLFVTIFWGLISIGLFQEINVSVGKSPVSFNGQEVAYKLAKGAYKEAGHLFTELQGHILRVDSEAFSSLPTIGIFYDNPEKVEANKCRYAVGVVLPNESQAKDKLKSGLRSEGYLFTSLPTIDHVVYTSFPYKTVFSILIAVKRVYPVLKHYIKEHNLCAHPALEIYEGETIHFIFPLSKQDQFYLFEEEEEEEGEEGEDEEESNLASNSEAEETGRSSLSDAEENAPEPVVKETKRKDSKDEETNENEIPSNGVSTRSSTCSSFEELRAEEVQ